MVTLTYASRATRPMTAFDLVDLLRVARDRNEAAGVTGLLLYAQESFLQRIEGEREAVDAVFASIRDDERHTDIRIVSQGEIDVRQHPRWTMGFAFPEPEQLAEVLPGYEPRGSAPLAAEAVDEEVARTVLARLAAEADD